MNPAPVRQPQQFSRFSRSVPVLAGLISAVALFTAPPAGADFPFPPSPREVHHEVHAVVHDVLRTLGRVPAAIHRDHVRHLQTFFGGHAYYGPHRHNHATYNFPVWVSGAVHYRPYVYCNGRLYGTYASRPQFWSAWGVASQGRWCGHHHAFYPTVHACFRPQYVRPAAVVVSPYPSHHGSYRGSHHRPTPSGHHGRGGSHRHDRNCRHDNGHHHR